MEETDNSIILITLIDSMGQSEETKRFDKTNYDSGNWIQDGYFKIEDEEGRKICVTLWGQISKSTIIIVEKLTDLDRGCLQIDNLKKKQFLFGYITDRQMIAARNLFGDRLI